MALESLHHHILYVYVVKLMYLRSVASQIYSCKIVRLDTTMQCMYIYIWTYDWKYTYISYTNVTTLIYIWLICNVITWGHQNQRRRSFFFSLWLTWDFFFDVQNFFHPIHIKEEEHHTSWGPHGSQRSNRGRLLPLEPQLSHQITPGKTHAPSTRLERAWVGRRAEASPRANNQSSKARFSEWTWKLLFKIVLTIC